MYAQNFSNQYAFFTCSDVTRALRHVSMYNCHGVSVIARKAAAFAEPTVETAVDEVSNLSVT